MGEIIEYGNLQRQKNTISRLLIYWTRIRELSSQPVSVSKQLSEKLQDVSPRSRTMRLASCFQSVLAQYPDNVVIKDIDVMFNPAYQVDVLKILTEARKSKPYSVIWPGRYENGTLYYSDKTGKFRMRFRCAPDEMKKDNPPAMIHRFMTNGRMELDHELASLWVSDRIIPKDRQNIADILRENNLTTYREIDMLELCMGRCTLDDIYLVREK